MKLEDIGGGSGGDIIKEFEDTKSRDEYLRSQLEDLENTIKSLLDLIAELRETVRLEFTKGIEKINTHFGEFFKAMFGGGNAFLSLVAELKKGGEQEDDLPAMLSGQLMQAGDVDLDDEDSISPKFERGVNIHVDLPNKKVKELTMLSGGERSLVSIALLFAMSQVNPPPFLVLDETDAALDEANSRRYGDMLERLSARTQLVVVTHNRETMSRAGTIYGVTMGADAVSKLLSIEFAEASKIAK
jgi:chromosome segregation protein